MPFSFIGWHTVLRSIHFKQWHLGFACIVLTEHSLKCHHAVYSFALILEKMWT